MSANATVKGLDLLKRIIASEYQDSNCGEKCIGNQVWTFSVTDGLGKSAGGIIADLREKGFVGIRTETYSREEGPMDIIWITESGYAELKASGWEG